MAKKDKDKEKKSSGKSQYEKEREANDQWFLEVLKNVRPFIFVLMDLLDKTNINPVILFQTIRHLNNLSLGSRYGKVVIEVQDGKVTFVRGEESSRLNVELIEPMTGEDPLNK